MKAFNAHQAVFISLAALRTPKDPLQSLPLTLSIEIEAPVTAYSTRSEMKLTVSAIMADNESKPNS
jgi:hypothetical protein